MTSLRERLDRLGAAGADGIELVRPDEADSGRRILGSWRVPVLVAGGAAALVAAAAIAGLVRGDDVGRVSTAPPAEVPADDAGGARVAVLLDPAAPAPAPRDVALRLEVPDGDTVTERWHDATPPESPEPARLVSLPAGDIRATVSGDEGACTQSFNATAGSRLVLTVSPSPLGTSACLRVTTVDEWAATLPTTPSGRPYLGLTLDEAEDLAARQGYVTRVVGENGVDFLITLDLRTDRLDLVLFDGQVVAASLGGE
ncbi:MAG TPA: hypothetical protein VFI47_24465 [Acidimicrobiales bacterium]|nr:hypothetical protein [Acidimicrobiales bacterium]